MVQCLFYTRLKHVGLDFNRDNSLKQHSKGKHRTHYPDTEPDRLCCYSLIYIVSLLNLETADTNFIVFCLIRPGIIEPMIYTALQPITLSFTPPRLWISPLMKKCIITVDTFARGLIQTLDSIDVPFYPHSILLWIYWICWSRQVPVTISPPSCQCFWHWHGFWNIFYDWNKK